MTELIFREENGEDEWTGRATGKFEFKRQKGVGVLRFKILSVARKLNILNLLTISGEYSRPKLAIGNKKKPQPWRSTI